MAGELERSQLNGDRLTGGGVGWVVVGCVGTLDRKADERPLALDWGGAVGGAGGLAFATVGAAEAVELPDDRENLFVIDSTKDGVRGGGVGGEGGAASAGSDEAFDGGSSSIKETSSREVIESRL